MDLYYLKENLLIRFILIVPLIFFAAKILFFSINIFKNKNDVNIDFEELVRRKTEALKFQNRTYSDESSLGNTEKVYRNFFELPENQHHLEKKKMLKIFSSIQWGEGPLHSDIIKYLRKTFSIEIDLITVTRILNHIIKSDLLISPKWPRLPDYSTLEQIISTKILFEVFLQEAKKWGGPNLENFCANEKIEIRLTCKVIFYYFAPNLRKQIIANILKNEPSDNRLTHIFQVSNSYMENRLIEQHNSVLFTKEIMQLSFLFSQLKEVEPLKSKFDLAGARKIFNLEKGASLEEIKKRYRSLAKVNHPDTLSGYNLPLEIKNLLNNNFSQIKNAYDLLVANELTR